MEPHIRPALGAALRRARVERDMTQEALGEALGVSQKNVSARELGLVGIESGSLRRILEALGVPRSAWGDFLALAVGADDAAASGGS